MTEDRGQNTFRPDLHPNPDTRTRDLRAETWDPKVFLPPANYPISGLPLSSSCLLPVAATRHPK
jgi:hypothetical protein